MDIINFDFTELNFISGISLYHVLLQIALFKVNTGIAFSLVPAYPYSIMIHTSFSGLFIYHYALPCIMD